MMVIKNENNEQIPTKTVMGWRLIPDLIWYVLVYALYLLFMLAFRFTLQVLILFG